LKKKTKKAIRKLMRHELAKVEGRLSATLDTIFALVAMELPLCDCRPGETCPGCSEPH
jgi:hypothetical protein